MNNDEITIQNCLDMYEKKDRVAVIENGQVKKFIRRTRKNERNGKKNR